MNRSEHRQKRGRGYLMAVVSAVTYGLNPLFGRPLSDAGMDVVSMLFYRYLIAAAIIGALMLWRKEDFKLTYSEIPAAGIAGVMFALSSVCLFKSFTLMDVGIASTILFIYPVFVTVIMVAMFKARLTKAMVTAIVLALAGLALLSHGESGSVSYAGVCCVLGSALTYAIYIVGVNKSRLRHLSTLKLTFYSMIFGLVTLAVALKGLTALQPIPHTAASWINITGLALLPTVVSLVTMAIAIRDIGSIPTSILGALEPVTALVVGIAVFGETLSTSAIVGVALVLLAVTAIVLKGEGH